MTRSFNGKQFKLKEHEKTLQRTKNLKIPISYSIDELMNICDQVQTINQEYFKETDEHRLLINISRGPLRIYHRIFDKVEPTVVVADFPLKWTVAGMSDLLNYENGINAVIVSQSYTTTLLEPKIKNRSRLFYQMANIQPLNIQGRIIGLYSFDRMDF